MKIGAITFVFNEEINLPIWIKHYGSCLGSENLFVVDRGSTDGSTDDLGLVNKIRVPGGDFDDTRKSKCLSTLHESLLQHYDCLVVSDCDEIVIPDPNNYSNLAEYIYIVKPSYVNCIGLNVFHIINMEGPLDLSLPILTQRKFAGFRSDTCKPLISSIPINWLPGGHSCDKPPIFDHNLFMFHLKHMDYSIAMGRQVINRDTAWSNHSLASGHGVHHRYDNARFVREGFLDPLNDVSSQNIAEFNFSKEIEDIKARTIDLDGGFRIPMNIVKTVEIPARFRSGLL